MVFDDYHFNYCHYAVIVATGFAFIAIFTLPNCNTTPLNPLIVDRLSVKEVILYKLVTRLTVNCSPLIQKKSIMHEYSTVLSMHTDCL